MQLKGHMRGRAITAVLIAILASASAIAYLVLTDDYSPPTPHADLMRYIDYDGYSFRFGNVVGVIYWDEIRLVLSSTLLGEENWPVDEVEWILPSASFMGLPNESGLPVKWEAETFSLNNMLVTLEILDRNGNNIVESGDEFTIESDSFDGYTYHFE